MRRNSNFASCCSSSSNSATASLKVSSSSASTANSRSPSTSSKPCSKFLMVSTTCSSETRSFPSAWAFSGSFHTSGCSNSALTSSKRSTFASKSKIPPKHRSALGKVSNFVFDWINFKHNK